MKSKNPFEYQGLSVQVLQGYTTASRTGNNNDNYAKYNIRYAKRLNYNLTAE